MTLEEIKEEAYKLFKTAERVWGEDECTKHTDGHVTLSMTVKKLTGKDRLEKIAIIDYGDHFLRFCEDGWIEVVSYDCDSLYKLEPK